MFRIAKLLCLLLFICLCCTSVRLTAQTGYLSVKQFGAKGDGVTDDTDAILRTIKASLAEAISTNDIPGIGRLPTYMGAAKTVFFPLGMYRISKSLVLAEYANLIGENAILVPAENFKNKGVAILSLSWDGHFEGLQFIGFNTALKIDNKQLDCGKIIIEDCSFVNNKTAIELIANNSISIIRENRFNNNNKVLDLVGGNKVIVSENWITSGKLTGKHDAQIINHGVLHFDRNLLVPMPPAAGAVEPAWINNYESVFIEGTRQGGEPGSFTLVNNFAKADNTYPVWPNAVVIKNSDCYSIYGNSASSVQPTALRLMELPNSVVLEDLRGFVEATVVDISHADAKQTAAKLVDASATPFQIRINNIQGSRVKFDNGTDLPNSLKKYEVK